MVDDTPTGHYFDATPASRSKPRTLSLVLPDMTVELLADRGVFSSDRVDAGTRYLLLEAPMPDSSASEVLDLGCGYGPIAVALAKRSPSTRVWAVDVNERAVELTRENAARLGLHNVRAVTPSDVPDDLAFDGIWSNPPIRIGKPQLHELLATWLSRTTGDGSAYLVVQKQLGADSLQRWLDEQGWLAERIGSRAGYRLLHVAGATT
jgi:16S rRNA (guanine1207-N2)-methyltransferase